MQKSRWLVIVGVVLALGWMVVRVATQESAAVDPLALPPTVEDTSLPVAEGALAAATPPAATIETKRATLQTSERGEFEGYHVRGRVLGSDGKPARSALVRVWEWEDPEFLVEDYDPFVKEVECDDGGGFEVRVDLQGEFRAWAQIAYASSTDVVEFRLNPRSPEVSVELHGSEPARIRGRVVDSKGRPVARAEVFGFVDVDAYGQALPDGLTSVEYWGRPRSLTNSDGAFELSPVDTRAVGYDLWCRARTRGLTITRESDGSIRKVRYANFVEARRVVPGSAQVELVHGDWIDTSSNATVQVTVDGGLALPEHLSYEVSRLGPRGSEYHAWSGGGSLDAYGNLIVEDLLPGGRYQISISGQLRGSSTPTEPFRAAVGTVHVPVTLPTQVPVTLTVVGSRGKVAERTRVTFFAEGDAGLDRVWSRNLAVQQWPLQLDLPTGVYRLEIIGDRLERHEQALVVGSEPIELEIALPK